jgi:hypothetical protein
MAQLTIPLDAKRFATGLSWKDYMAQMGDTRPRTEENYQKSALTAEERQFFGGLSQVKYAMMLAENWCGDVHRNSPLLAHICEAMPGCELRVFFRDKELDLEAFQRTCRSPSSSLRQGLERDRPLDRRAHAATHKVGQAEDAGRRARRPAGAGGRRCASGPVRRARQHALARAAKSMPGSWKPAWAWPPRNGTVDVGPTGQLEGPGPPQSPPVRGDTTPPE